MKTCQGCIYAEWKKTKAGKLHPSGDGRCTYEVIIPVLPYSFSWRGHYGEIVNYSQLIAGGFIERHRELKDHCPMWSATK